MTGKSKELANFLSRQDFPDFFGPSMAHFLLTLHRIFLSFSGVTNFGIRVLTQIEVHLFAFFKILHALRDRGKG
jgi:hypothetical protein